MNYFPLWHLQITSSSLSSHFCDKYKEGNNRPSSINQISLVHNHDKAGNKCYTQDNTNTRENPSVIIGAAEE